MEVFVISRRSEMMRFEVHLTRAGKGHWMARLNDGAILLPATLHPRVEVAGALLEHGAHPLSELVIMQGGKVIAFDHLGWAAGRRSECGDLGVVEKD